MLPEKLRIIPLGGLGEIGMNCLVLEWGDEMVLIDCGLQFPDASYTGVDLLTPDLSYVRDRFEHLRGIVVTHGHDDHIGAIPFLSREGDLDVWSTPFPRGLIEQKMVDYPDLNEIRFHEIVPRQVFQVGPFHFDPIPVAHSIIEALAFGIQTPVGNIVHSGDFKHDPGEIGGQSITFAPLEEWGKKGVSLLLSDSTNAERAGHTLSELDIVRSFDQILASQSGRILIALFASNIRRIENLLQLARRLGKKVALAGRSMHSYTRLAHEQGTLNIPPDTLVLLEDINRYRDQDVVVLLTGSQAEPQSALVRISQGIHKDFQIRSGDMVVMSSRFIPGNEKNITTMIDHLYRLGAEVIYEDIHEIHVSGHGYQEELLMMLNATKPHCFVPIHGEFRHLSKHAKLARQSGVLPENILVIEDGQVIEHDGKVLRLAEKHELQKGALIDGTYVNASPAILKERHNLSRTGVVFAIILRDAHSLKLVSNPQVSFYGLLFRQGETSEETREDAELLLEDLYSEVGRRGDIEEVLRLELRRFFRKRVSHKPVVIPLILDI